MARAASSSICVGGWLLLALAGCDGCATGPAIEDAGSGSPLPLDPLSPWQPGDQSDAGLLPDANGGGLDAGASGADGGGLDAGSPQDGGGAPGHDGGTADGGGRTDSGVTAGADAGAHDAGAHDAGASDAGAHDAGANDSGTPGSCGVTSCGLEELCTPGHRGVDDDCDGEVDEGCDCKPGASQACFKGDPALRTAEGCVDGLMQCQPNYTWGPCEGGLHATDNCSGDQICTPVRSPPFLTVDLSAGSSNFGIGAESETWSVTCPDGVEVCPTPEGANFTAIQSGEYTITYQKTVGGVPQECTYPLLVGARGLRVELTWDFAADVDLDLYMHKPGSTADWSGTEQCYFSNCKLNKIAAGTAPDWFDGVAPPDPMGWYLDDVFEENTCYFAPRGKGQDWQALGQGCYSPRLDLDNISCSTSVTNPNSAAYCAPENINVDFPPNDEWIRIGVRYYEGFSAVPARVRVFCDGELRADLGPSGFVPPVSLRFEDFWSAADIRFPSATDPCDPTPGCDVRPVYANEALQTPFIAEDSTTYSNSFGPGYPMD